MSVVRWTFQDASAGDEITLPVNPNKMDALDTPRNMSWVGGQGRMRGFESAPQAQQITFAGVVRGQSHYSLLLDWAKRLSLINITDHLNRNFQVVITKFDPVERQGVSADKWHADYTMTCLLIKVF